MDAFELGIQFFNSQKIVLLDYGIGSVNAPEEWSCINARRPYHIFYYLISGKIVIHSKFSEYPVEFTPGHAYLLPSSGSYDKKCTPGTVMLAIHFFCPLANGNDLLDMHTHCVEIPVSPYSAALQSILNCFYEEQMDAQKAFILKGFLYTMVGDLLVNHKFDSVAIKRKESTLVKSAIAYVKSNLSAKLKVSEVALATKHDANYLSKRFLAEQGINLKTYIENQLYQKALLLLITTDLSIQEIADQLNFSTPYYFSAFVKKFLKQSPANFRKSQGRLRPFTSTSKSKE